MSESRAPTAAEIARKIRADKRRLLQSAAAPAPAAAAALARICVFSDVSDLDSETERCLGLPARTPDCSAARARKLDPAAARLSAEEPDFAAAVESTQKIIEELRVSCDPAWSEDEAPPDAPQGAAQRESAETGLLQAEFAQQEYGIEI